MRRELCIGLAAAWIVSARPLDAHVINTNFVSLPPYSTVLIAACETLLPGPFRQNLRFLGAAFFFHPEADGGGDGGSGSGDGGSGSGDGGDGSAGGSDSGDTGSGASDSTGSVSNSTGPGDNGDPDADPSVTNNNSVAANESPTDPVTNVTALDFAAQQAYDAVANPFGGVPDTPPPGNNIADSAGAESVPSSPDGPQSPGNPGSPGREPNAVPPPPPAQTPAQRRAEIHAVIVSGLADPSQVLRGNVHLTGGIIAIGSPNSTTPQPPGRWDPNVKITPDPELLNGHKIPPLVPNVIDVRIMHHEVSATIESEGSITGRPEPALNEAGRDGP
jgi:hypothetical protein